MVAGYHTISKFSREMDYTRERRREETACVNKRCQFYVPMIEEERKKERNV